MASREPHLYLIKKPKKTKKSQDPILKAKDPKQAYQNHMNNYLMDKKGKQQQEFNQNFKWDASSPEPKTKGGYVTIKKSFSAKEVEPKKPKKEEKSFFSSMFD